MLGIYVIQPFHEKISVNFVMQRMTAQKNRKVEKFEWISWGLNFIIFLVEREKKYLNFTIDNLWNIVSLSHVEKQFSD